MIEIEGQNYMLSVGGLEQSPYPVILARDVPILTELLQSHTVVAEVYIL